MVFQNTKLPLSKILHQNITNINVYIKHASETRNTCVTLAKRRDQNPKENEWNYIKIRHTRDCADKEA